MSTRIISILKASMYNINVEFEKSQKPKIFDGVTYFPIRQLFEEMGAAVSWNVERKKRFIKVERDGVTIVFPEGNHAAIVNGKETSFSKPLKLVNIQR
ncbi:stalk domain-containing protein [Schinkia sp. CFF1]